MSCEKCGSPIPASRWDRPSRPRRFCSQVCAATRKGRAGFWDYVDSSGGMDCCWEWMGVRDRDGYGIFYRDGSRIRAHRHVLALATGERPVIVRHHCDHPPCCNPLHLAAGDHLDNARDMIARGRQARFPKRRGEDHPRARLREPQVLEILDLLAHGTPVSRLARSYGVSEGCVWAIKLGKNWSHLKKGPE